MNIRTEISVLVCCLVFFCLSTSGSPSNGVGSEVIALMGIKSFLVDPIGVLENWDEASPDPCSWSMVTCSADGQVIGLGAPSQGLSGVLAPSIGNLTNIQTVDLSFNNLSGKVPIFPAQVFNIEGNPYLYTKGTDMVDKGSLPNSSKAKLNKSGIFYVITILMVPYYYSHLWDSSFFI
ncbi:protein NSP-INTERACTING KINASE 1 isoform X1 [Gossypium raimondii]|uniref:protein NSP-INTERACTING KINASE 1 isoform X1 n=1 Tax=Gossypium raimondii TaxID=29730 RepID=UPI00227A833C|nr:protein NSP-INTERACTING KINASE 1 isoform X1 [Gossypium raimondii]